MRTCLLLTLTVCALLSLTRPAAAQPAPEVGLYGVVGAWSNPLTSGKWAGGAVGVEAALAPRLSTGVDVELLVGFGPVLIVSPTARIRLIGSRARQAPVPFLSAGYSYLQFFTGTSHAWHAGAGLDHELDPRHRVRLDVRRTMLPGASARYWTARAGVVFR